MFRGRESVFAKRWENLKTGKSGYAPACENEWVRPICQKPAVKCSDCLHQKFPSLNDAAVEAHLKGNLTIGTYAIKEDDSSSFLACDFDEKSWRVDVMAFAQAARNLGVEVAIERSRSGNGAHAWIFFQNPIPARIARSLGTLILSRCSELDIRSTLSSYDRFFPAQDFVSKGGFGNLIALPLQKVSRENGNSCFVDENFEPFSDQWAFLSQIKCLSHADVQRVLSRNIFLKFIRKERGAFDDLSWDSDQAILDEIDEKENESDTLSGRSIELEFGAMVSVPIGALPKIIIHKLKKLASFANPEFYKLQRMRMQTYPHRRFIFSGDFTEATLRLPRGLLDRVIDIFRVAGADVVIRDERIARRRIKVHFVGTLNSDQQTAVKELKKSDTGVLMAPPGAGKTVIGCALIAERKVSTLILAHRKPLLDQWKHRLNQFLEIPLKEIGVYGGSKKKVSGKIDLAMLQTLTRAEELSEIAENYSQIIIDECHHIPASSFESVMKQLPARYVVGLSATPYRKDGLEKILFQQCGPIRFEIKSVDGGVLNKVAKIFETGFRVPDDLGPRPPYHALIHLLTNDPNRNSIICERVNDILQSGSFPLMLSDRKDHLDSLIEILKRSKNSSEFEIVHLHGDLTSKQRALALSEVERFRMERKIVLLAATGSLIGEGFDLPELDALVLATPLSFEGRMIQYAGRIHRLVEGKKHVQIIDFIDSHSAIFLKMARNRMRTYEKMGYSIEPESTGSAVLFANLGKSLRRSAGFFPPMSG